MRSLPLALFVTLGTTLAGAQSLPPAAAGSTQSQHPKLSTRVQLGESPIVLFAVPGNSGCPIGLTAERRSAPGIATIGNNAPTPLRERIQLGFEHALAPNIDQVTVVVHGLSGKSYLMPLASGSSSDTAETFDLARGSGAASLSQAYLRLTRVHATQWIELTRIDFADGSIWVPSRTDRCIVTPSKLVLVSNH